MNGSGNDTTEIACPQCGAPVAMPGYADMAVCAFCGSTLRRDRAPGGPRARALAAVPAPAPGPAGGEAAPAAPGGFGPLVSAPAAAPAATPFSEAPLGGDEEVLHSVQCSQCAGPLSVREGRRILVCRRCGVRVMVKEHGGVSRWYFPTRLNRLKAAGAAAAWLSEYPGIARDARDAQLGDARLTYAPIWEHRLLLAGWEFGRKLRTVTEFVPDANNEETGRMELRLAEEAVKESRLQERRFYQPATDFEALGATRPRVTGRELLLPLLAGELDPGATVLTEEGTGKEVADRGRRAALQPVAGAMSPDSHLFAFRESTALLYYPLWTVDFRSRRGPCRVVVNGRDGTVNSAMAPADNTRRVLLLAGQTVLMAAVVAVFVLLAATRETGRASFIAAAVIVAVIAVLTVWRFRTVGEVEYREPFSS